MTKFNAAGTYTVEGCKITRGNDSWIVTSKGGEDGIPVFVGEVDTYGEAEVIAKRHRTAQEARVQAARDSLAQIEADAYTDHRMRMGERGEV
jgi:hypothetical protein